MEIHKFAQDLTLNIIHESSIELQIILVKSSANKESAVRKVNENTELTMAQPEKIRTEEIFFNEYANKMSSEILNESLFLLQKFDRSKNEDVTNIAEEEASFEEKKSVTNVQGVSESDEFDSSKHVTNVTNGDLIVPSNVDRNGYSELIKADKSEINLETGCDDYFYDESVTNPDDPENEDNDQVFFNSDDLFSEGELPLSFSSCN